MKKGLFLSVLIMIFTLAVTPVFSEDTINGYLIPEYYMISSQNEAIDGQHGLWLRRIYFGYDTDLGEGWSARVRFEMNTKAFAADKMVPYIKNAHIQKKLTSTLSLIVGIIDPPSFDLTEKFWDMRHIEKTTPDLFKFASSRDFGLGLNGKMKSGLNFSLMFGNYGGEAGDSNKGKAVYGRLGFENKSLFLDLNGHMAANNGTDITYLSAFAGLKGDWGRAGAGYIYRNDKPETGESKNNGAIWGLAAFNLSKKAEFYARYDHLTDVHMRGNIGDFLPILSKDNKARVVMSGVRIKLHKLIEVIPNIKYVFYSEGPSGIKPKADFHILLTGFIKFKSTIL
jgi:hypothetical protein